MSNMKAERIIDERIAIGEEAFIEMALWRIPNRVPGCAHDYKYRLAYIVGDVCVLRYDNERGKGDHRHCDGAESALVFSTVDRLLLDFRNDVRKWNDENRHP
jgi:hypothetical protein